MISRNPSSIAHKQQQARERKALAEFGPVGRTVTPAMLAVVSGLTMHVSRYQFSEALFEGLLVEVVEEVVNAAKHWYRPTSTELAVFRKVAVVLKRSLFLLGQLVFTHVVHRAC